LVSLAEFGMTSPATSARLADDIALAAKGGERQRVITEVRRINGRRVTVPAVESPSPFSSMGEFRDQGPPMETREGLLKADKVSVVFERIADGKIRVTTSSWDDAKVILANQVLEVATISKPVGLVRVDKPIAYLDIDDTGLVEAGYGPETE
jgi:hypothetical protein